MKKSDSKRYNSVYTPAKRNPLFESNGGSRDEYDDPSYTVMSDGNYHSIVPDVDKDYNGVSGYLSDNM